MTSTEAPTFAALVNAGHLCAETGRAMAKVGYTHLSPVQVATLQPMLAGHDCMARAKTGTGKTLAFLLPTVELLKKQSEVNSASGISVLILSPTRELSQQIEQEARTLLAFMPQFSVQCVVGGTNVKRDVALLNAPRPPTILVATPGRLLDLLQNYNLAPKLAACRHLILDECDRLLDAGFSRDVEKIVGYLPDRRQQPRQGLLFSATISNEIKRMASLVLLSNYVFVSTVTDEDDGTHAHVEQQFMCASMSETFPTLLAVMESEFAARAQNKIIVFFPTARATQLAAELFNELQIPVAELHSRKSQSVRQKVSEAFRSATNAILFSSDVSARGLDFPGITLVVQIGLPSNREQYIHRLGRTARAGETGRGLLILSRPESFFLRTIDDVPIKTVPPVAAALISQNGDRVHQAMHRVSSQTKSQCYAAHLGFYKAFLKQLHWTPEQLVAECNAFAVDVLGFRQDGPMPPILRRTAGKMGLGRVAGLNLVNDLDEGSGNSPGGGRGAGRGQGRGRGGGRGGQRGRGEGRGRGGRGRGRGRGI